MCNDQEISETDKIADVLNKFYLSSILDIVNTFSKTVYNVIVAGNNVVECSLVDFRLIIKEDFKKIIFSKKIRAVRMI